MNQTLFNLNLHYLFALRDEAVRDLPAACHEFGVTRDFAEKICEAPLDNLRRLANCNVLLFQAVIGAQVIDLLVNVPDDVRPAFMGLYAHAPA